MIKRILFATVVALFSFPAFGQNSDIQVERFQSSISILKSVFFNNQNSSFYDLDDVARKMPKGPNRVAAFKLQALGKVYTDYDGKDGKEFFKDSIRFEFKGLEDAIGEVDKWDSIIEDLKDRNPIPEKKLETAKIRYEVAKAILKFFLTQEEGYIETSFVEENLSEHNEKFIKNIKKGLKKSKYENNPWFPFTSDSKLARIEQDLNQYDWKPYDKDRKYVVKHLIDHMENLEKTRFNFSLLEDTETEKGLHEYRREVRWFAMKAGVINGTISFLDDWNNPNDDGDDCPNLALKGIVKDEALKESKYSKLPQSPFPEREAVCGISRCLFYKISDIVAKVGDIKDEVERGNFAGGNGNVTPPDAQKAVEEIYREMVKLELLPQIRYQLNKCL
ncbi:MAG: hypothetical protein KDD33_04340 [Bdellovibrionales bacterium]|nr:hypothetical protein [Bdellovibrionales bacterium]